MIDLYSKSWNMIDIYIPLEETDIKKNTILYIGSNEETTISLVKEGTIIRRALNWLINMKL